MGLKKVDYYTIECDNSGCLHSTKDEPLPGDAEDTATLSGWILTMDKEWLCPDCNPITKTNRNKNMNPLVECLLKDYGIMLTSGEAAELLKKARVG